MSSMGIGEVVMGHKKKINPGETKSRKMLKDFVADEDGLISRATLFRVGLSVVAGLGVWSAMTDSYAAHGNAMEHANAVQFTEGTKPDTGCVAPNTAIHQNSFTHTSHNNASSG
ncbi:MAG: hypothetical protein V2A70_05145 [Candidatus Omnitrophota bacterium]